MYCKHCGKQISDNSVFCQYCGNKLDSSEFESQNSDVMSATQEFGDKSTSSKMKNEDASNKRTNSAIANEIVANLKMIGFAIILSIVYVIGFIVIRSGEAKPLTEDGYYGESCYDPSNVSGGEMFLWEQHYAKKVCMAPNYTKKKGKSSDFEDVAFSMSWEPITGADLAIIMQSDSKGALSFAESIAKKKQLPQSLLESYALEAKEDAKKDKEIFREEISSIRKDAYEADLKKHSINAAIICLSFFVFGRYLIKLFKWVGDNKTV